MEAIEVQSIPSPGSSNSEAPPKRRKLDEHEIQAQNDAIQKQSQEYLYQVAEAANKVGCHACAGDDEDFIKSVQESKQRKGCFSYAGNCPVDDTFFRDKYLK